MLRRLRHLDPVVRGAQRAGAQQLAHHDAHLEHRKAGAEAAAATAAEGDPGVGAGLLVEEALGPEGVGVGVDVGVVVDQVAVGDEAAAGRVGPAADLDRLGDVARRDVGQDRTGAQRLLDRRGHVRVVVAVHLVDEPRQHLRLAQQPLERPRQRGGRRLVAGDEEGEQLVADLLLAHRRAVLVAGRQQHREHVVAVLAVRAPLGDQCEDDLVDAFLEAHELRERADPFGDPRGQRFGLGRRQADRLVAEGEHFLEPLPQLVEAGARVEAEDGPQDDLQRQVLHAGVERHRRAARQFADLGRGDLVHQAGQPFHPLAVEGGEHQLALLHVRGFVEQDHRVGPDDRFEHPRAVPRLQHVGRRGEDFLDLPRVGEHHERRREGQADREALPVTGAAALQVGERPHPEAEELDGLRGRGTGR